MCVWFRRINPDPEPVVEPKKIKLSETIRTSFINYVLGNFKERSERKVTFLI